MKNFSNKYIFIYSAVLVALVAVILSVVAMGLKSRQENNIRNEKMQTLLATINVESTPEQAAELYQQYFKEELTVSVDGNILSQFNISEVDAKEPTRAFNINLKKEQLKQQNGEQGAFPIYVFEKDGKKGYVIPTQGKGLWGAIYSNIALDSDLNTIVGVSFNHESETPGLGAEITTPKFQNPFIGKQILDENGDVISIAVKKHADQNGKHEVDAISGGTMTSKGVNEMLAVDLKRYEKFIKATLAASQATAPVEEPAQQNNEEEVTNE